MEEHGIDGLCEGVGFGELEQLVAQSLGSRG